MIYDWGMRRVYLIFIIMLVVLQGFAQLIDSNNVSMQIKTEMDYLEYLPPGYVLQDKWPLILFLHGSGERGTDLQRVKIHGPLKVAQEMLLPFVIIAPQCREKQSWSAELLTGFLATILNYYPIDPARVYVTGLSMGGTGTWELAKRSPDLVTAIAPICGRGSPMNICNLKNMPVWAFHGAKDQIVPLHYSTATINKLKECGGNAKLTIYPDAGHDSWTITYDNPELYEWFLEQTK
jgi:predicted peptidase